MKRLVAIIFIAVSLAAPAQKWAPLDAEHDSLVMLCEATRNNLQVPAQARSWVARMHELAREKGSDAMEWRALYFESWFAGRVNDYQTETRLLDQALAMVDSVGYEYDYRRLKWNRNIRGDSHRVVDSYRWIRQNLDYFQSIGDYLMVAVMYLRLCRLYDRLNMPQKAEEYMALSEDSYRKAGYLGAIEYNACDKIIHYARAGEGAKAAELYRQALDSPFLKADSVAYFSVLTSGYYTLIDSMAAYRAYELACQYGKMPAMMLIATSNMGAIELDKGNPRDAVHYFRSALGKQIKDDGQESEIKLASYAGLFNAYAAVGQYDSAFCFAREYMQLRDSVDALYNGDQFMADIEAQLIEQEEAKFDIERRQARGRITVILLIAAALILIAAALAYRHRMLRRLKEADNERLAAQAETERLQKELYRRQCEDRERELTTNSLLLVEKKKMIQTLNEQIQEYSDDGKIDSEAKRRLLSFIKIHNNTEQSLQQFYDYFNQVHPDFFQSLKQSYPDLTQNELRLCAYIRMGLDNKQIAQILGIQSEAIKKARYRMRKKLRLATADSLEDFLMLRPADNRE